MCNIYLEIHRCIKLQIYIKSNIIKFTFIFNVLYICIYVNKYIYVYTHTLLHSSNIHWVSCLYPELQGSQEDLYKMSWLSDRVGRKLEEQIILCDQFNVIIRMFCFVMEFYKCWAWKETLFWKGCRMHQWSVEPWKCMRFLWEHFENKY